VSQSPWLCPSLASGSFWLPSFFTSVVESCDLSRRFGNVRVPGNRFVSDHRSNYRSNYRSESKPQNRNSFCSLFLKIWVDVLGSSTWCTAAHRNVTSQNTFWFVEPEEVVRRDSHHLANELIHLTFQITLLPFLMWIAKWSVKFDIARSSNWVFASMTIFRISINPYFDRITSQKRRTPFKARRSIINHQSSIINLNRQFISSTQTKIQGRHFDRLPSPCPPLVPLSKIVAKSCLANDDRRTNTM